MPLPPDAHYVSGTKQKFVRLADGTRVTRYQALKLGAQKLGFNSEKKYNQFSKRVKGTEQYKSRRKMAEAKAKKLNLKGQAKRKYMIGFDQRIVRLFRIRESSDGPLDKGEDTPLGKFMTYIGLEWNPATEKWDSPTNDSRM